MLLPFGGHKGYGLGILVDLLTGALTGSTVARGVRQTDPDRLLGGQAFFMLAINISFFSDLADYIARADQIVREAKAISPAEGFQEVVLPGELESREEQRRTSSGLPRAPADWQHMVTLLRQSGVPDEIVAGHAPD